jgi:hypothetical protein
LTSPIFLERQYNKIIAEKSCSILTAEPLENKRAIEVAEKSIGEAKETSEPALKEYNDLYARGLYAIKLYGIRYQGHIKVSHAKQQ